MKKRIKKQKSILQDQSCKQCYLCMLLNSDYSWKYVEDHHIYFGNPDRQKSERYGFKVNLCLRHHREGPEAVHNNSENDGLLKEICQREYEKTHTRQEFYDLMKKSYLDGGESFHH